MQGRKDLVQKLMYQVHLDCRSADNAEKANKTVYIFRQKLKTNNIGNRKF